VAVLLWATVHCSPLWARGGGGCISPDTKVATPNGPVPVENLKVGDLIWTWNLGSSEPGSVEGVFVGQGRSLLAIRTKEGTLSLTKEHLVMTGPGEYRRAESLASGKKVLVLKDGKVRPRRIREVTEKEWDGPVYNLLVWPGGTFASNSILIHNKGCFLPDTPVLRSDGTKAKISQVKPGDKLLAFDPGRGLVRTRVLEVLKRDAKEHLELRTEGVTLEVTPDHPLFLGEGKFRSAGLLHPGETIWAWDGGEIRPQKILSIRRIRGPSEVFHLRTDLPHTFFAGGVLVHNKGGGSFGRSRGFRSSSSRSPYPRGSSSREEPPWIPVAIFIVLVILIIVVSRVAKKSKTENLDYLYSRSEIGKKAAKTEKLMEFLARQDPTLAPGELAERVRSTFVQLQKCWEARDYGPMKPLMAPALYHQHVAQLKSMERNHEINRIEDLQVEKVDLVHLHYTDDPSQRSFTALITAKAKDYYVDDRTGKFLRGDKDPAKFQEFWTFRLQDSRWVLSEIEQAGESDILKDENFVEAFTQDTLQRIYGEEAKEGTVGPWMPGKQALKATRTERLLNFLVRTDPLWDKDKLLERAREVFMVLYLARESGDPAKLPEGDLFPDLAQNLREQMEQWRAQGLSLEMRNLCVRKVTLVLVRNFQDSSRDDFTVRIDAHAQRIVRRGERIISQEPYVTPFEEYWTFGRLDGTWKLKEVLPPAKGRELVAQENIDEESTPGQLQWYYRQERAL